jgi:hypothetical protein
MAQGAIPTYSSSLFQWPTRHLKISNAFLSKKCSFCDKMVRFKPSKWCCLFSQCGSFLSCLYFLENLTQDFRTLLKLILSKQAYTERLKFSYHAKM